MSDDAAHAQDTGPTPDPEDVADPAAELRAQIAATRADLAAAAAAIAARMNPLATTPPADDPVAGPDPAGTAVAPRPENLPVLYRRNDTRRAITLAGAVLGTVVLAYRISRRFRR